MNGSRVSRAFCRGCGQIRTFFLVGSENGTGPLVRHYRCRVDSFERMEMGGVPDIEGLCRAVLHANLRRTGTRLGTQKAVAAFPYDDALAAMMLKAYAAYRKYDPTRGVPFLPYVTAMVRHGLSDWYRDEYGRSEPKLHVGTLPLHGTVLITGDDGCLEAVIGSWEGDPAGDTDADLRRVLAHRSGEDAREERSMGIGPASRASAGDPGDRAAGEPAVVTV